MSNRRQLIPLAGLLATSAAAIYMVSQLNAQDRPLTGNFTNAAMAEVRDLQGQVLLSGPFVLADEDDDDVERKAVLSPTGSAPGATGKAEVEFETAAPSVQEIEFSARGLQPGASYTFVIDGQEVGSAAADGQGRVKIELDIRVGG